MPTREDAPEGIELPEAARRLGVHYMTAYRYVRTGRLAAVQHRGQWWVSPEDLVRVEGGRTEAAPTRALRASVLAGRLRNRLLAGDESGAWQVLEATVGAGRSPESALLDVLAPALREVGDAWERGDVGVGAEHRASVVAARLLARLGPRFTRPGRSRGCVVLACVAGELHALPLALVAMVLRGHRYTVVEMGADTPPDEIADATRAAGPALVAVGLSAMTAARRPALRRAIRAVRGAAPGAALLVGGTAVESPDLARRFGADGWAADALGVLALLDPAASPC